MKTAWFAILGAALFAHSTAVAGENTAVWLEATPVAGSIGVAWRAGENVLAGIEGGAGIPQLDRTFLPGDRDFVRIVHLGGVMRFEESRNFYAEIGPQAGIGDLDNDPRSGDDMPNLFAGFSAAFMFGGRRWRLGPGLDLVWIFDEPDPSIFVANLTPLALRVEW
jgi:hypothetical protein